MSHPAAYAVDLDLLAQTIESLVACEEECDRALDDVVRQVGRLHLTWEGQAAAAQLEAQARWETGFATMREGLAAMRTAASTARTNYGSAVRANLAMWERL